MTLLLNKGFEKKLNLQQQKRNFFFKEKFSFRNPFRYHHVFFTLFQKKGLQKKLQSITEHTLFHMKKYLCKKTTISYLIDSKSNNFNSYIQPQQKPYSSDFKNPKLSKKLSDKSVEKTAQAKSKVSESFDNRIDFVYKKIRNSYLKKPFNPKLKKLIGRYKQYKYSLKQHFFKQNKNLTPHLSFGSVFFFKQIKRLNHKPTNHSSFLHFNSYLNLFDNPKLFTNRRHKPQTQLQQIFHRQILSKFKFKQYLKSYKFLLKLFNTNYRSHFSHQPVDYHSSDQPKNSGLNFILKQLIFIVQNYTNINQKLLNKSSKKSSKHFHKKLSEVKSFRSKHLVILKNFINLILYRKQIQNYTLKQSFTNLFKKNFFLFSLTEPATEFNGKLNRIPTTRIELQRNQRQLQKTFKFNRPSNKYKLNLYNSFLPPINYRNLFLKYQSEIQFIQNYNYRKEKLLIEKRNQLYNETSFKSNNLIYKTALSLHNHERFSLFKINKQWKYLKFLLRRAQTSKQHHANLLSKNLNISTKPVSKSRQQFVYLSKAEKVRILKNNVLKFFPKIFIQLLLFHWFLIDEKRKHSDIQYVKFDFKKQTKHLLTKVQPLPKQALRSKIARATKFLKQSLKHKPNKSTLKQQTSKLLQIVLKKRYGIFIFKSLSSFSLQQLFSVNQQFKFSNTKRKKFVNLSKFFNRFEQKKNLRFFNLHLKFVRFTNISYDPTTIYIKFKQLNRSIIYKLKELKDDFLFSKKPSAGKPIASVHKSSRIHDSFLLEKHYKLLNLNEIFIELFKNLFTIEKLITTKKTTVMKGRKKKVMLFYAKKLNVFQAKRINYFNTLIKNWLKLSIEKNPNYIRIKITKKNKDKTDKKHKKGSRKHDKKDEKQKPDVEILHKKIRRTLFSFKDKFFIELLGMLEKRISKSAILHQKENYNNLDQIYDDFNNTKSFNKSIFYINLPDFFKQLEQTRRKTITQHYRW